MSGSVQCVEAFTNRVTTGTFSAEQVRVNPQALSMRYFVTLSGSSCSAAGNMGGIRRDPPA
jgi:hypothetical protein